MRKSLRAKWWWSAVAVVVVLLAIAIGALRFLKTTKGTQDRLVLGDASSVLGAPVWVAEARSFFGDEGLDVAVRHFEFGRDAMAEMFQDRVDVATVAATPIVLASFTRRDFVVFANISYVDNNGKIIARRDRAIKQVSDLSGKTIGASKGTSGEYFLETLIAHYGLPREKIVVHDISQSDMPEALSRGDVDAVATFEPFGLKVRRRLGNDAVVITAPEVYRETFNLVVRRAFAETHRQALVKFLRAVRRAENFIRTHPAEAQAIMAQRSGLSSADVATFMPDFTFALSLHQSLLPLFEDEARWAIRAGRVQGKQVPNYLDLMYPDALNAIDPQSVTIIE